MQIIFLGTSAGKPTTTRNVSAIALKPEDKKEWLLFDCGEATQHQILKISNLSIAKLRYIFITHLHGDHIYGIFGLLASRSMIENVGDLTIFGPKNIKKLLNCVFENTQLNLSFNLEIVEIEPDFNYKIEDFDIYTIKLSHSIETYAFLLKEKDKPGRLKVEKLIEKGIMPGPIYAKIKNQEVINYKGETVDPKDYLEEPKKGRVVIIAGDNDKPDILLPYAAKFGYVDLLVHEATYTQDVFESLKIKVKHSTAKDVAIAAEKMGVKNLILTHFSSRYTQTHTKNGHNIEEIYNEARRYFNKNLFLANDFDVYELDLDTKVLILKNINQ